LRIVLTSVWVTIPLGCNWHQTAHGTSITGNSPHPKYPFFFFTKKAIQQYIAQNEQVTDIKRRKKITLIFQQYPKANPLQYKFINSFCEGVADAQGLKTAISEISGKFFSRRWLR
jgi:hypothetical protein